MTRPSRIPEVLAELLDVPGVSGFEHPVAEWIDAHLPPGLRSERDAIGNLTVHFGRSGPRILLIVHSDEIGFLVTGIRPDGAVYLHPVGHWDLVPLGGAQLELHTTSGPVPGVVITVPPHLGGEGGAPPWIEGGQLVVDLGCDSPAEVEALGVDRLQSATLLRERAVLAGNVISARGLDNRFGCYLLLELARQLMQEPPAAARVTLAWASQEEIGFRGPHVLANSGDYDAVIAIDAFPADRRPGLTSEAGHPRLGAGPVLRGADLTGVGSLTFVRGLRHLASDAGISVQPAYARGHNQASVFPASFAVALDLPIAYLHSGCESLHRDDLQSLLVLLERICAHPRPETLWT